MRAILLILILAVVALIAAFATGLVSFPQTREARAPSVTAEDGQLKVQGGQAPAFEVQTGEVAVGTRSANVAVPAVEISRQPATVKVPAVEVRKPGAEENAAQ
ncbi:hypothetical protein [Sphingomonas xanthus]|uniref:Uncharacterized protein n=1 Tax=Sphingomonas xanthus TaxID=2594473 RepID=A0A516IS53_9SPHN|nr:hypothetical protein [Sphingomonas xanthus]QDP19735.1 hypothetical protein FMM02_07050 [Sphingomonas xanthus]